MAETVGIDSLRAHPDNPRRGSIEDIADSLAKFGQYQPIIVRTDGTILCGHHTWEAARMLGWDSIVVSRLDIDDDVARRIMLADNRTTDLASYDDSALLELLACTDLDGTGFNDDDVASLRARLERDLKLQIDDDADPESQPEPEVGPVGDDEDGGKPEFTGPAGFVQVPEVDQIELSAAEATELAERLGDGGAPPEDLVRAWLGMAPAKKRRARISRLPVASAGSTLIAEEEVAIDDVSPHPDNARQGDVGAISESLGAFGQYRPIVANRRDGTILAGSHRWMAARALGWETIRAVWVDVDEDRARQIMVADNRTSDLGRYDDDALFRLLNDVPSLEGTGFDMDDIDDLFLRVSETKRSKKQAVIVVALTCVGARYEVKEPWRRFDQWLLRVRSAAKTAGMDPADLIAQRLGVAPAGAAAS